MTMAARKAGTHSPLWLQGGYRLLFGAGALWAVVVVILWVGALDGRWSLPTAMTPLAWHQHEMLFGYLGAVIGRSEEHTSELQSLMRISYAVFCLKKKRIKKQTIDRLTCNESKTCEYTV